MPDIIKKRNSWITWIILLAVAAFPVFYFWPIFVVKIHLIGFLLTWVIGVILFAYTSWYWLKTLREAAYEYWSGRLFLCAICAVFLCLWVGVQCAQYKVDAESHIEYNPTK